MNNLLHNTYKEYPDDETAAHLLARAVLKGEL